MSPTDEILRYIILWVKKVESENPSSGRIFRVVCFHLFRWMFKLMKNKKFCNQKKLNVNCEEKLVVINMEIKLAFFSLEYCSMSYSMKNLRMMSWNQIRSLKKMRNHLHRCWMSLMKMNYSNHRRKSYHFQNQMFPRI